MKRSTTVWYALVIEGEERACRAFVAGFGAGRRTARSGAWGRDYGLERHSLGERVRALLAGGAHHLFLTPKDLAVPLAEAIAKRGRDVGLRLTRRQSVESMQFDVKVEAFSRRVAKVIRRDLITNLPRGVRVDALSEAEVEDPSARGTELYSPVHEYIYRASGRIAGQPPGILEVYRRASGRDCVSVGGLQLNRRAS